MTLAEIKCETCNKRGEAYAWLAEKLGIPVQRCHIGEFDATRCREVVRICEGIRAGADKVG
jgi:hypothetical protein